MQTDTRTFQGAPGGQRPMNRWDRVRTHTDGGVNRDIDIEIQERVRQYAGTSREVMTQRIEGLEREWSIERWLEMNASALAFTGVSLGALVSRKWLLLPAAVLAFLFQHAVQGWCPPIEALRRLGVRTRHEIDVEKYALKALRGDFAALRAVPRSSPDAARAVSAAAA